jgi:endonuclease/exonuclease/phosphatase family metal-dependent hydrolase
MTNNHVIKSEAAAAQSVAEFDFEEGRQTRRIAINPDRFFITNPSLDYTIVGCDDQGLDDISPIRLQRNPALITEQERVVVIQHPRARKKEVALHDNRVTNLLDRVLRYRTDTEPGSSGSPVFNNAWELVALHHAGERDPDGTAENEGILISAIVNDLTEQLRANPRRNRSDIHSQLLEGTVGTSPFMGFFDTSGIFDDSSEVQVDTFTGDRDFADVGFWNIEHFNNGVSDDRIGRVADVFRRLSLDAYGLSEVQEGALDRLVEEMATHGFNLDFEVEDVTGGQDLAIVYDADTTTVEHLVVDDDGFDERVSGKRVFPRRPMFAKCSVSESDGRTAEFIMIVVHLKAFGDSLSRERRRRASRTMVRVISELRNDLDLPVVFGGDFNEKLTTNVLDSIKNAPDLLAITSDDAVSGAASFIGNSKSLIDHIVISNDVKSGIIDGDDAAIVRLDRSVAHFSDQVSDHVPLVMRIILEGESDPLTGDHDDVHSSDSATTSQTLRIPRNARHMFVKFE